MNPANVVTLAGAALSMAGVVMHSPFAILAGLACDAIDGPIARTFECATRRGAALDWQVDITIAHALVWTNLKIEHAAIASAFLALVQWFSDDYVRPIGSRRMSGRAIVTLIMATRWLLNA